MEMMGMSGSGSADTLAVISVVFGADCAIKAGPGAFVVDARYNWGLNSIEGDDVEIAKYSSLAVSAGYQMKL